DVLGSGRALVEGQQVGWPPGYRSPCTPRANWSRDLSAGGCDISTPKSRPRRACDSSEDVLEHPQRTPKRGSNDPAPTEHASQGATDQGGNSLARPSAARDRATRVPGKRRSAAEATRRRGHKKSTARARRRKEG